MFIRTRVPGSRPQTRVVAVGLVVMMTAVAGCGSGGTARASNQAKEVVVSGEDALPSSAGSDWVSYPHHIVLATAVDERAVPLEGEPKLLGEGPIGREVDFRVDQLLWSEAESGRPAPKSFTLRAAGWVLHEGKQTEMRVEGAPRLEVGETVIAPLSSLRGEWIPLSTHSMALLINERVVLAPGQDDPVVRRFVGLTVREVAQRIAETHPDPVARKYRELPPYERGQAVLKEKNSQD